MDNAVQDITRHVTENGIWLKDFFVFLAAAALVVPLFQRARIGAVAGFLLVGLAVGPYGLGRLAGEYEILRLVTIEDRARVEPFAELGVMFLLFLIGLELSFSRLWSLRRFVLGVGLVQFAGTAFAFAIIARLFGAEGIVPVLLGLCAAMSSTAVVMQLLDESGRATTSLGRVTLSILLFQDLMVAPALFGVELLAEKGSTLAGGLAEALLQAAGAFIVVILAGRYLLRPLFRFAAKTGSRDLIMAMTVLIVVAMAGITGAGGLSTALGAFLAGILLGESEYRHQIEIDLAPFKGLLLGLFFVTVGMSIDLAAIAESWPLIVGAVLSLIAVKAAITFGAARMFGVGLGVATESGLLLAQAGEFGFVIILLSQSANLIPAPLAQAVIAAIGLSMLVTPLGAALAVHVGRRMHEIDHRDYVPVDDGNLHDHVIIGGYGRVGQAVAHLLAAERIPYVALDANGELVSQFRQQPSAVYFGDAARGEMLARAGGRRARVFAVTLTNRRAAERMVVAARLQNPNAVVLARASDRAHAERLTKLGAIALVPETLETSLQLGERLLGAFGVSENEIERRLGELRRRETAPEGQT